eukprot:12272-Heterococcus_DN1.PRE.5
MNVICFKVASLFCSALYRKALDDRHCYHKHSSLQGVATNARIALQQHSNLNRRSGKANATHHELI